MNTETHMFTGRDKLQVENLARLIYTIVILRIQKYVREEILNSPGEKRSKELNILVLDKCWNESLNLMYLWIGLLKYLAQKRKLRNIKMKGIFTIHQLLLPRKILLEATKAAKISYLKDDDVEYIFSEMTVSPRFEYALGHVRQLLRLK